MVFNLFIFITSRIFLITLILSIVKRFGQLLELAQYNYVKLNSIKFLPQYQRQSFLFLFFSFQSASWKRHCATHWRELRGMDSYQQRQVSQSDCKINSNCAKKEMIGYYQGG